MRLLRNLLLLFMCCTWTPGDLLAQLDKFSSPQKISDVHTVYQYQKSNWDGTHRSDIFLYIGDNGSLESYKWGEGDKVATLVKAWIDWNNFSIRRFENWRIEQNKDDQFRALLEAAGQGKVRIELGELKDTIAIDSYPWHSYDFDLAGLGFSWRALKDKKANFSFHIADVVVKNGKPTIGNKGPVQVNYEGEENIGNKKCLRYSINGEGLENKGGTIWIDTATWMIQRYKIALPDEEGFENSYLDLLKIEKMSPEAWRSFVKEKVR